MTKEEMFEKTDTPNRPFQKVNGDMVGPLPKTTSGNKLTLTFQDYFSKLMICLPKPDREATTVARIFFAEIIANFKISSTLITTLCLTCLPTSANY